MQTPSMAASTTSYYPIPKSFLLSPPSRYKRNPNNLISCSTKPISPLQTTTHRIQKQHLPLPPTFEDSFLLYQFSSPTEDPGFSNRISDGEPVELVIRGVEEGDNKSLVISSNMWWADLKAALGQRINVEGIVSSVSVIVKDRHLVLPHVSVRDLRYIDWGELKRKGFKGVVFDKDNTLTAPYSLAIWPPLRPSIEQCKAVFGHDIAVFSNSAGLTEYDHDDSKAKALEAETGIRVLRHKTKKPAGTAEEVEKHFGCASSELIMVGDRPFTDIVYGNRNGFLTVLTEPLSRAEEPFIVRQVRRLELALLKRWLRKGLKPVDHILVSDVTPFVKDPSDL
ncbi:haloacid dehalogenase (HAD) superfamily protein [Raphanus sativus]|uniref:Phosphatidylglycerophosphate phosphatase 1, chloroplastic/mitochondrial n=1 Tax=Raphanus sativus TaxID=3726 RepID=A0A6J0KFL4_RAPSA|nr:phosphatidylglycerophosphate phosphatase 1, chloroplastic/mitochondrial [Raphanus sativus]KAJ4885012.1 haloacid dehalogenase (HAD) superfamily protein [Raphanus sativus]